MQFSHMADHHVIVKHPLAILVPNLDDPVSGGADEDAWLECVPLQAVDWAVVGLLVGFLNYNYIANFIWMQLTVTVFR